jgi:ankyrin repeat protein
MSRLWVTAFLLVLFIPLTGCQKSPEDARKELSQLGLQYTSEASFNAAKNGDTVAVKLFLVAGMNPDTRNEGGSSVLEYAAASGHTNTVLALLDNGASGINDAMKSAVGSNRTDTLKALINKGADVNAGIGSGRITWTALEAAIFKDYVEVVQILIANGVDVNARFGSGRTALSTAKAAGHTEIVNLLKQAGARE